MNVAQAGALLAIAYASLFFLERAWPLRRPKAPLVPRLFVNAAISATAFATAALLVQPAAAAMLGYTDGRFGLLPLSGISGLAEIAAAFLLFDLTFYYWHVANHRSALLWRFHNVHHVDPDLDVSTAFRFHFVEVGFSAGFRALQVLLIGPSFAAYVAYEIAFQLATLFHHSNLRLPVRADRLLNLGFVTPRMHGIHHSDIREEDLSNFGVVLSCWDRLHCTLRGNVPQAQVNIGIPAYAGAADNQLLRALLMPFQAQRDYWSGPDGPRVVRTLATSGAAQTMAA